MVKHKKRNLNELAFSSLEDFKQYVLRYEHIPKHSSNREEAESWSGVRNWEDFMTFMQEGNKDITKQIKKYTEVYINKLAKIDITETNYAFDVTGLFFDIGTVLSGEPEAWLQMVEVKEDKFIEINLQGAYSYTTDAKIVQENGAKIFALAVALEKKEFLVKINFVFRSIASNTKNKKLVTEAKFTAKDYDQMLDYKKMGILLSVPFFRRGVFRLLEIEYDNNLSSNYGRTSEKKDNEISLSDTMDICKLEALLENK